MALNAVSSPGGDILHPAARNMFAVWDTIRQGRSAPCRNELDLRSIKKLLPHVALIERHPVKSEFTFRLAGTGLRKIFGEELTGTDFLRIWPRIEQSTISGHASDVIIRHQPCSMRFKGFTRDGRAEMLELMMLPLLPTERNATHILATLAPLAEPYWLGDYPIVRTELISMRTLGVERSSEGADTSLINEVAEPVSAPEVSQAGPFQLIRGGIV